MQKKGTLLILGLIAVIISLFVSDYLLNQTDNDPQFVPELAAMFVLSKDRGLLWYGEHPDTIESAVSKLQNLPNKLTVTVFIDGDVENSEIERLKSELGKIGVEKIIFTREPT